MTRRSLAIIAVALLSACARSEPPPLEITDVRVYAPLPGSKAGVAYMTIINNSSTDVTFTDFDSDSFAGVELHETSITDDVARMRRIPLFTVAARTSIELREGGKHLMLMEPDPPLELGATITLTLTTSDGTIVTRAPLEPRLQLD